ncbi:MAG: outer membrane protein assembly factor BamA [Desulfobulbales bacterium]|nr:outer membrane protein assembly factor BamA [Desulfobulbales bacterium]
MISLYFRKLLESKHLNSLFPCSCASLRTAVIFILAALLIAAPLACLATEKSKTLVLPLKINTPTDKARLTNTIDSALQQALESSPARMRIFSLLQRNEAKVYFDYNTSWPPPLEALQKFGSETAADVSYIAVGSLTKLGDSISIDIKVYNLLDPSAQTFYYLDGQDLENIEQSMDNIFRDVLAYTGRSFLVASITPEGNTRIDSGAILRNISSRPGDIYETEQLRNDIKNVFKMGYFDDVRIRVKDTEKGKAVIFEVKEKPVVGQVGISGRKELKEDDIREVISIIPNTILNSQRIRESVDNIKSLYKSKGFYNTDVTPELSYPKADRVNIEFSITEGEKVYIKDIKFVGNDSFKESQLKKAMGTKEKGLLSWFTDSGVLTRDILEQDTARITSFYHHHGFIEATVGIPEITQDGEWLYITIDISEGNRYRVGTIEFNGDIIGNKEELSNMLRINDEEYLSRNILREDILRLNDFYAENGYAFAEATPTVRTDKEQKLVDITIDINKGDLVYINRINIRGNTRTRDKVIRRALLIREKGIFDAKALRLSHQRLMRLNFFEDVSITPEPTPDKTKMDLKVEVKEKPTGAFSVGAGYSSVDGLMFMAEISQDNFLGRGQRLALSANISGSTTRYNLSFTEPHFYDSQLMVGLDFYNWLREYDTYTRDSRGAAFRFGYPVWELWNASFSYGYDDTELTDVDLENAAPSIIESMNVNVTSYVTFNLSRDTRNNLFATTRGSHNILHTKYAGGFLSGDSQFTKVDGSTSWFFPGFFFDETAFHIRLSAGQVWENEDDKLPDFEKFYLGGINTIRGFETRSIAVEVTDPESGETYKVGGKNMWFANLEYLFPIVKQGGLRGLVFYDAGNVYAEDWDFDDIKQSVGAGLRWLSPMGPMRIEWGYVIDPEPGEDSSNWEFAIGGSF